MRTIPSALQTRLGSGVTTLCRCWVIKRADGVTQGFTDHDEDIALDAVACRAGGGLTGNEVTQKLGLPSIRQISPVRLPVTRSTRPISPPADTMAPLWKSGWSIGVSRHCACYLQRGRLAR